VTDCTLTQCTFHTKYPNVKGCMLVYMNQQGEDSLSPLDISMLTGRKKSAVIKDLSKAVSLLRGGTLRASNQSEIEPQFVTLMNQPVCYNCEKALDVPPTSEEWAELKEPVDDEGSLLDEDASDTDEPADSKFMGWDDPSYKPQYIRTLMNRSKHHIYYCSPECKEAKPTHYVALEARSRVPVETIVKWAVNKYSTLGALEQALGISRTLLGETVLSILGIDADRLYPTTKRVRTRNRELVRRTGSKPDWLVHIDDRVVKPFKELQAKLGESKKDHSYLVAQAEELIRTL